MSAAQEKTYRVVYSRTNEAGTRITQAQATSVTAPDEQAARRLAFEKAGTWLVLEVTEIPAEDATHVPETTTDLPEARTDALVRAAAARHQIMHRSLKPAATVLMVARALMETITDPSSTAHSVAEAVDGLEHIAETGTV